MDQVVRQHADGGAVAHHRTARPADQHPPSDGGRAVSTRYGQLTYTSFDSFERARSAGGWQVKQSSGELSADETQWLVSGIRTAFRPVEPLPDYPSPQELDAAPRRLAYR